MRILDPIVTLPEFELGGFGLDRGRATGVHAAEMERSQISTVGEHSQSDRPAGIRDIVDRVTIGKTMIRITLSTTAIGVGESNTLSFPWTAPSPYRRRDIIHGATNETQRLHPMPQGARTLLIDAIRQAHRWLDRLLSNRSETIETIASHEGKTARSIRMTLSLAFLAPDIIKAATDGRLPRGFGLKRLVDLPTAWPDQWRTLGLKAPPQT